MYEIIVFKYYLWNMKYLNLLLRNDIIWLCKLMKYLFELCYM